MSNEISIKCYYLWRCFEWSSMFVGEQQGCYVDVFLDCARKTWSDSN